MTREERKSELRIIISHLESAMNDLLTTSCELEELRCSGLSKKVNIVCGHLQNALWAASEKEASL